MLGVFGTLLRLTDTRMKLEEQVEQLKATSTNGSTVGPLPTNYLEFIKDLI